MTPRHAPIRLPSLPQLRLRHISELQPGTKVLIFARVSHDKQRKNLGVQARRLRRECTKRGLEVMMVIKKVQSAKLATEDQFYGSWLRYAVEVAQQHGWAIIAESESRLLRHPD